MRPTQIRRLLVFVVCAAGVAALYVVPGLSTPPLRLAERVAPTGPTAPASPLTDTSLSMPSASPTPVTRPTAQLEETSDQADPPAATAENHPEPSLRPRSGHRSPATRPTNEVDRTRDRDQPAPVVTVEVDDINPETVTVRWAPTHDNVAVVRYQVWLNGFEVATTSELSATVDWFNDDMGQHVVQVLALDAAGNESDASPSLMVTRPSPAATPTSAPSPSDTATAPTSTEPAASPEPTNDQTSQPSVAARPNGQPNESDPTGEPHP